MLLSLGQIPGDLQQRGGGPGQSREHHCLGHQDLGQEEDLQERLSRGLAHPQVRELRVAKAGLSSGLARCTVNSTIVSFGS